MAPRLLPCGPRAVLVELDDLEQVLAVADAVRSAAAAGDAGFEYVVDVVPAAVTVLVVLDEDGDLAGLRRELPRLASAAPAAVHRPGPGGPPVEIVVRYDGPDLDEVAAITGLTRHEVVRAHTSTDWRVAFGGFAPGFAYLIGGDARLRVPRRREPRTTVPAGSVAVAGEFSAVYPRSSPGGWQLLGQADVVLFDVARDPPALLGPGATVRFVERRP